MKLQVCQNAHAASAHCKGHAGPCCPAWQAGAILLSESREEKKKKTYKILIVKGGKQFVHFKESLLKIWVVEPKVNHQERLCQGNMSREQGIYIFQDVFPSVQSVVSSCLV